MHVGIISECAMSHAHGTGVQMLRTFEAIPTSYSHFYFSSHYAGLSEVRNSYLLDETLPFGITGKRSVAKYLRRVGINWTWWNEDNLNTRKFARLLAHENINCDVMYALVATEQHARRALAILHQINRPYVVHIMDLYDSDGIIPEKMPAMRELLENADSILVLTESIAAEVRRVRQTGISTVSIGTPHLPQTASPPCQDEIRIALTGRTYEGIDLLVAASPEIEARWPCVRFVYCGNHHNRIPEPLRSKIQFPGWLTNDQVRQQLLASHLAFLCGPYKLDGLGKFSFPSRVADFLMAGLPIIAAVSPGTAARQVLASLDGSAVRLVDSPDQIITAIESLISNSTSWLAASTAARQYAETHFNMDLIRDAILQTLAGAGNGSPDALSSRGLHEKLA